MIKEFNEWMASVGTDDKIIDVDGMLFYQSALSKAINNIEDNPMFGFFVRDDYKNGPSSPIDISHTITDIEIVNNSLTFKINALNTPMGKFLKELLDAKLDIKYKLIGEGESDNKGIITQYKLISIDVKAN